MYNQDVDARKGITQLALEGFFRLAKRWHLSRTEAMTLLGLAATSTYANWKNGKSGAIPRDTLERITYLLNIDEQLQQNQISDTAINQWLRHTALNGGQYTPLEQMLKGNVIDIYSVHQQLALHREQPVMESHIP
tara:strand:+ start:568 stop:972 length:405 start_codon:yes stop_codon:yes gene_type:complete